MAINAIRVLPGSRLAFSIQQTADHAAKFMGMMTQLKEQVDAYTDGSDYTALEVALGLPAGKGADLVFLVANAKTASDAAVLHQFVAWLGGLTL